MDSLVSVLLYYCVTIDVCCRRLQGFDPSLKELMLAQSAW